MFCGEVADDDESKKGRAIKLVNTPDFKQNIIRKAEEFGDTLVINRIINEHDLIAVEAKYHSSCHVLFVKRSPMDKKRLQDTINEAMKDIFYYIENNDDSQFTLKELRDVLTGYVPDDQTIIYKLREKYLTNIIITTKVGSFTIISFRDTPSTILSKAWYESKKGDVEEERLRIVQTAAAIIREDIRSSVVETKSYPPPNGMLDKINQEIPNTLLYFLQEIIMKNRRGKTDHLKTKCTSISHAIMASMRERTFSSQLLLGLSVFLHRRYGSKRLLDVLSSLGFSASYTDTVMYELSALYHQQPNILPLKAGVVQYVGDIVHTLDGNNTLHMMGIVTPKNAVVDKRIKKCTTKPSAKELAQISHVPLLVYEKPIVPGLSRIQIQNLNNEDEQTQQTFSAVDFLWLYGKWKKSRLPGWKAFLEQLTKNNKNVSTSEVMFFPFINSPASNMDTIYTTLNWATDIAKSHGQNTSVITFDQPLYINAREIVAAFNANSKLSKVVVKLGGFQILMSFLGCIGYIMDGSGIKEVLSTIYATNSVDNILDGHAYLSSIRGHTLLRLALSMIIFEDMKMENCTLDNLIEQISCNNVSYETVEGCVDNSSINQFQNKLNVLKAQGPTAKLWIQYFEMVSIAADFISAERLGDFKLHLDAVKKMLPYFYACGRFLYAKSAHLYLQDMLHLEETMDQETFEHFTNGFFTVRSTNNCNSGTSTDVVIEQSLMNLMKTEEEVLGSRSTQETVLCKWICATNTISGEIEKFCNVSLDSAERHANARKSRVKRDNSDVAKLVDWFVTHNPFQNTNRLISVASGVVGTDQINCHRALEIGLKSMNQMTGLKFNEIKSKRANKVLPISAVYNSIKVNNITVAVDPLVLFQRITGSKKFEDNLKEYSQYELSPLPTSLFTSTGMRKITKAKLYNNMTPVNVELDEDLVTYVIDGESLLHQVVWNKDDTFSIVLNKYIKYLQTHYENGSIVVVFDGHSDHSKNIKAMEQFRRTSSVSKSYEVSFNKAMVVPIRQEKFLSNSNNRKNFINMLIESLATLNIATKQARGDVDVLIVETAIEESQNNKTAVIVGEDIDLLVLLIGRTQDHAKEIFLKKIGNVETRMYSTKSFDKYPRCKEHVLFLHAFSGCDTTSALFNKGKLSIIKMFEKHPDLHNSAQSFKDENSSLKTIFQSGMRVLLAVYNAPISESNIDNYRYTQFMKCTQLNKPMQLSSLPPTSAAARQHIYRVYYQVQTWLGNILDPEKWGWIMQNGALEPRTTLLPAAPEQLLNAIFCNCKKECGVSCSCRKVGLQCSEICGQCNGRACLNAPVLHNFEDEVDLPQLFDTEEINEAENSEDDDDDADLVTDLTGRSSSEDEDDD